MEPQILPISGKVDSYQYDFLILSSLAFGFIAEFVDLGLLGTVSSLISILPFILLFVYPEIQIRFMQAELSPEV